MKNTKFFYFVGTEVIFKHFENAIFDHKISNFDRYDLKSE